MRKQRLIKRLRQLCVLEFINVFFLPFCFWSFAYRHELAIGVNSMLVMILSGFLLLQGSYLWYCITREIKGKGSRVFVRHFRTLKVLNLSLFVVTSSAIAVHPFAGLYDRIGTTMFLLLAVLEYINYFEIQLMYDNKNDLRFLRRNGWPKKAKLKGLMVGR